MLAGSGATWFVRAVATNALALLRGEGAAVIVTRARPAPGDYLRRWWRVRRSIFLCFFLRIRLRRFLISEPIRSVTLPATVIHTMVASRFRGRSIGRTTDFGSVNRGSIPLPGAPHAVRASGQQGREP